MIKLRYTMRVSSALFALACMILTAGESSGQATQQGTREKITSVVTTNTRKEITAFGMRDVLYDILSHSSKMTPTLNMAQLRQGKADTARVVNIQQGRRSGMFIYDPTDQSSTDDGALTLRSGNRVYKRDIADNINIEWYGAIPDDGISDRQAIIDAMNAAVARGKRIRVPLGSFHIGGRGQNHISLISNVHIFGDDREGSKLIQIDSTNKALFVAINRKNISLRNLTLEGGKQDFTTVSVQLDRLENGLFEDLVINNLKQAFYVYGSGSVPSRRLDFRRIYFKTVYDFAIRAKDNSPEDITIVDCVVDSVLNNTAFGETSAFRIMGKNIDLLRPRVYYSFDTGIMISGVNNDGIRVRDAYIRSKQVSIFVGTGAKNVSIIDCDLSSSNDHAIHAYNPAVNDIMTGNKYSGNRLHDCAKSGLYIEGSSGNTADGNFIYRNGKKSDVPTRERTGITIIPNSQSSNSANNTITNNIIYDDQATKTMQRGVSVETQTIAGLTIENNVVQDVTDANKVYYATNVTEKSLYSMRAKIETPVQTFTSHPVSTGEFTTANRPAANLYNGNALLWNRTTQNYEFSNGSSWVSLSGGSGGGGGNYIPRTTNDTISGQKTWSSMGVFLGASPQVKLAQGTGYVDLASSAAGNLVITPSSAAPTVTIAGSLVAGTNTSNLNIPNNTGVAPTTTAGGYQVANSTTMQYRVGFRGNTTGNLTAGASYGSVIVGTSPVGTATTGTHEYIGSQIINAPDITVNGTASVANTGALIIGGESNVGLENYGLINRAKSKFLGLSTFYSDIFFNDIGEGVILKSANGAKWRIVVDNIGNVSSQSVP